MFRLTTARSLAFTLFALTLTTAFAQNAYRVVVASKDPAPTETGRHIWLHSLTAQFDSAGNLSVSGQVRNQKSEAISDLMTQSVNGDPLEPRIQKGQVIPGIHPERKVAYIRETPSGFISAAATTSDWTATKVILNDASGNWPDIPALIKANSEAVHCVSYRGQSIPNSSDTIATILPNHRIDQDGNVTFLVRGEPSGNDYLLRHAETGLTELARMGGAAPAEIGGTFTSFPGGLLVSSDGSIVYSAWIMFPGATASDIAVLRRNENGTTLIMRRGEHAAGLPDGWTYRSTNFHLASCNATGKVLFRAQIAPPDDPLISARRMGYWLADGSGPTELIAIQGETVPGSNGSVVLDGFGHGVVNATGDVAFSSGGICLKRAGQPTNRIVFNGMRKPGTLNANFDGITGDKMQLNSKGYLLFADQTSTWVCIDEGNLVLLYSEDEPIQHKGTTYHFHDSALSKGASGGEDGFPRRITDDGRTLLIGTLRPLDNGSWLNAVVEVTLPHNGEPNTVPIAANDLHEFTTRTIAPTILNVLSNDSDGDQDPLTITSVTQGLQGTVTIKNNSILYTPTAHFGGEDAFSYTISDGYGGTSSATVTVRNHSLGYRGTYETFIVRDGIHYGSVKVTISATGRVTGRLFFANKSYRLSGSLSPNGSFGEFIEENLLISTTLGLTFIRHGGQPYLSGAVIIAARNVVSYSEYDFTPVPKNAFALPEIMHSGRLTARFTPGTEEGVPQGIGFAVGSINSKGSIVLAGRRPDGTPFSTATALRIDKTVPVYIPSTKTNDSRIYGELALFDLPIEFHGDLRWEKGLVGSSEMEYYTIVYSRMAPYIPPQRNEHIVPFRGEAIAAAEFFFTPPIGEPFQQPLSLSPTDVPTFTAPNANRVRTHVNRRTGLLSGSFQRLSDAKPIRFYGAAYPMTVSVAGSLTIGDGVGRFELK